MVSTSGIRAGKAYVELSLHDRLTRGLRRAQARLRAFGETVGEIGQKMTMLGTAGVTAAFASAKKFASMGDHLAKMSKRTGFSVEALSRLSFAASQSGTSIDALEVGLRRMQRSIYDAGRGLSTQSDALRDLGLSYKKLAGLTPEEQFRRFADALANVEDATRRAALAQVIFGRQGTALLPLFAQGAAGLDALSRKAESLGLIITSHLPASMEEERVAAMAAAMLSLGDRTADELRRGELEQVYVQGGQGYVLLRRATSEALVLVLTTKKAKLGLVFLDVGRLVKGIGEVL